MMNNTTHFLKMNYPNSSKDTVVYTSKTSEPVEEGRAYLNGWRYNSNLKTGYGVFELSLLRDLIKDKTNINAIDRIVKKEDGTYEIAINKERLANWLDNTYLSSQNISSEMISDGEVKLLVTLSADEQYIESIKTSNPFTIKDYSNNSIDVKIENVNETTIKTPQEMLAREDGTPATGDEIKDFIKAGVQWWESHTGSEVYEGY